MALITTAARSELIALYVAMFKAAPGAANLTDMVTAYEAGGTTATIAKTLAAKADFATVYPGFSTGAEFSASLVANLLGSNVTAAITTWAEGYVLGLLNGGKSRADAIVTAVVALRGTTNTEFTVAQAAMANSVDVASHYSITKAQGTATSTLATLQGVIAGVTSVAATATTAKATIDTAVTAVATAATAAATAAAAVGNTLTTATQSLTGTAGDDTFSAPAGTWGLGDVVNGGTAGTDTLNATISGVTAPQSATSLVSIEVLNLTASPQPGSVDLTGVVGLTAINNLNSANNASVTVSGVGKAVNSTITNSQTATTIGYTTAVTATTAVTDAATLTLAGVSAGSSYTATGIDQLTINSTVSANTLSTLSVSSAATVTIGGDKDLTLGTVGGSLLTAVNAAGFTGTALTFVAGAGLGSTAAAGVTVTAPTAAATTSTITTGTNRDTVTLGAGNATLVTGGGNDTINSGAGVNTITPGAGNDVINVTTGTDTIRFEGFTSVDADTINAFSTKTVIGLGLGVTAAAATATAAATSAVAGTFGVIQTGATTLSFPGVNGAGTGSAIVAQTVAPNATASSGTVTGTSNVLFLTGALANGTAQGVLDAMGTTANTGITTAANGKFVIVTYSVGNIAQVWSVAEAGNNTDVDLTELTLVATLNNVAANSLTAANFATYTTAVAASTTANTTGQVITLAGLLNTVSSTTNASGQFLTAADDAVTAPVGVLPTAAAASLTQGLTLIDASATDNDSFTGTVLGAGWDTANTTLVNIETVNLNFAVADANGFDMTAMMVGTNILNISGTAGIGNAIAGQAATGTNGITLASGKTIGFDSGFRSGVSTFGAATATLNLAGNTGTTAATSPSFDMTAATTALTINVNGTTGLNLGAGLGLNTELVATDAISVRGGSNLTIYAAAGEFNTAKITATLPTYTGSLTLTPSDNAAMDFSDATSPTVGIRTIAIPAAYASAITLNELNTGAVTISAAATIAGNFTVAQAGSGQSDTVTVSFGSAATGSGNITATSIENLTIAGATASTATLTVGNVTLTDGAGAQVVTITNAGNLTAGTVTADVVNISGVLGNVTALTLANAAGVSFTGGAGNTNVTGSANADVITTGIGNDTVTGTTGADLINLGTGDDSIAWGNVVADAGAVFIGGLGIDTMRWASSTNNLNTAALIGIERIVVGTDATAGTYQFVASSVSGQTIAFNELAAAATTLTFNAPAGGTVNLSTLTFAAFTDAQGGAQRVEISAATDTVNITAAGSGTSAVITGTSIAAVITGGTVADTLTGGAGNDTITGGAGIDNLIGNDGNDVFIIIGSAQAVTANAAIDLINGGGGTADELRLSTATTIAAADLLARITNVEKITSDANAGVISITITALAGTLTGTSFNAIDLSGDTDATSNNVISITGITTISTITGSAGIDTITLGLAAVAATVTGGPGIDILTVLGTTTVVYATLDATAAAAGVAGTNLAPLATGTHTGYESITGLISGSSLNLGNASLVVDAGVGGTVEANEFLIVQGAYAGGVFTVGGGLNTGADSLILYDGSAAAGVQIQGIVVVGLTAAEEANIVNTNGVLTIFGA